MSNQAEQLQQLIKDKQEHVDTLVSLNRLVKNRDFIKIIEKGYFEKEAINLVMLKAEFHQQDAADQVDIIKRIDAIGELRNYLRMITAKAQEAENRINEAQATLLYINEHGEEPTEDFDDAYSA